jgi:hypothetical protein
MAGAYVCNSIEARCTEVVFQANGKPTALGQFNRDDIAKAGGVAAFLKPGETASVTIRLEITAQEAATLPPAKDSFGAQSSSS